LTQVAFLTGVSDKLALALRLLRKKHREGARVAVFGPPALLNRLDQALWADDALSFLPHLRVRGDAPAELPLELTPIWLLDRPVPGLRCDSAINLGADEPAWLQGFDKVAELVGSEDDERLAGRRRWKHYETSGCTLSHHPQ